MRSNQEFPLVCHGCELKNASEAVIENVRPIVVPPIRNQPDWPYPYCGVWGDELEVDLFEGVGRGSRYRNTCRDIVGQNGIVLDSRRFRDLQGAGMIRSRDWSSWDKVVCDAGAASAAIQSIDHIDG